MANQPLLSAITQNPLLISAESQQLFQDCVHHVVTSEHAEHLLNSAVSANEDEDFWSEDGNDWKARLRPYNVNAEGVLQIPVMGVLLNRFPYQLGRWATGYTYIERALERGLQDYAVKAIAFVEDSPGGEVAGCFELVDKIYEARGQKPMRSFAADHAYSAAYAIASAANDIVVTRSGGVGSIGVVMAHVEYSEMLKDLGIKVTFIFAGKHKVDGNAYEKLPDNVKSRLQDRIDRLYGVFTSTVARNRGMDEKAVRGTEALTYDAQTSIEVGLADRIGALDEEMVIFANGLETEQEDDEEMTVQPNVTGKKSGTEEPAGIDQATHDKAVADATAAGATGERDRIKAILACDNAKTRQKAALSFALNTDMTVDQAAKVLADLPEEKAEAAVEKTEPTGRPGASGKETPFEATMNNEKHPNVGAEAGTGDENLSNDEKATQSILADYKGATGRTEAA